MHEVEIVLDKPRKLRFDVNNIAEVEDHFRAGIITLIQAERVGFSVLRHLVWAGLKWEDRKLTPNEVGRLLHKQIVEHGATVGDLFSIVNEALVQSKVLGMPEDITSATSNGAGEHGPNEQKLLGEEAS